MKKIICLLAVVLMVASVAFAASKITGQDLASLKGNWEGMVSFGMTGTTSSPAKLEILNDTVPVRMRLTLWNVPEVAAQAMGVGSGGTVTFTNDDGEITTQGTLMFAGGYKNYLELTLDGDKLKGSYYVRVVKGDMVLNKK